MKNNYKILLFNFGYARGWDGSLKSFFKTFHRLPFQFFSQRKKELEKLKKIIDREKPDLILISEIESKKCKNFIENLGYFFNDMSVKYGEKSLYRKIPAWHNNSNAFFSKEKIDFEKLYFSEGAKKLIYKLKLPFQNTTLFFAHFSLVDKTRKRQIKEIDKMSKKFSSKIIAGDFNLLTGLNELDEIIQKNNFKLSSKDFTYPSYKPQKAFDLFLISANLKFKTKILKNEKFSDHLPVILEVEK